jgi:hypothetical protein
MERRSAWFEIDPGTMFAQFPKFASLSRYKMQKLGNQNKMILFQLLPGCRKQKSPAQLSAECDAMTFR